MNGLSPISGKTFPVAVTIMSRHLVNNILKQAGINQKFNMPQAPARK